MSDEHQCFIDFFNAAKESPATGAQELIKQLGRSHEQADIADRLADHLGILGASFVDVLGDNLTQMGQGQAVMQERFAPGSIFEISPQMRTAINQAKRELGLGN